MPTKPEGPAQEPQMCTDCEVDCIGAKCRCPCHRVPATPAPSQPASQPASLLDAVEQLRAIPAAWKERPDPLAELHETRYGSQPAGARELEDEIARACAEFDGTTLPSWREYMKDRIAPLLAQPAAAKDAELKLLTKQYNEVVRAHSTVLADLEAAERERDSLRAENERLRENWKIKAQQFMDDIKRMVEAHDAESAALKAGKE